MATKAITPNATSNVYSPINLSFSLFDLFQKPLTFLRPNLRPNQQFLNIYKIWVKNQIYTHESDKVILGSSPCHLGSTPCQRPAFRTQPDLINISAARPILTLNGPGCAKNRPIWGRLSFREMKGENRGVPRTFPPSPFHSIRT